MYSLDLKYSKINPNQTITLKLPGTKKQSVVLATAKSFNKKPKQIQKNELFLSEVKTDINDLKQKVEVLVDCI